MKKLFKIISLFILIIAGGILASCNSSDKNYIENYGEALVISDEQTKIDSNTLDGYEGLRNVEIPNTITSVEEDVFRNWTYLKNVYYKGTIEDWIAIEFKGFFSNPMINAINFYILDDTGNVKYNGNTYRLLVDLVIPDNVTSIGAFQFLDFDNIVNVTIPQNVTSIDEGAFMSCSSLENVYYKGTIEDWCNIKLPDTSVYGIGATPMFCAKHFYILNENSQWNEVTNITIPDSISSISSLHFYSFDNLLSVTIPASVTKFEQWAFYGCYRLEEVYNLSAVKIDTSDDFSENMYFPAKAIHTSKEEESKLIFKDDFVFLNDDDNYYLINYLGDELNVKLPANVNGNDYVIREYAFLYSNIKSVDIPANVTSIDYYAFANCFSLENVNFAEGSKLKSICRNAFANCYNLISITIPESVTEIDNGAFYNCYRLVEVYNLSSVEVSKNGNDYYGFAGNIYDSLNQESKIIHDGDFIFYNDGMDYYLVKYTGNSTEVVLPNNINNNTYKIIDGAFAEFDSLKSIVISDGVISIGYDAFYNCSNLETVTIQESITSIKIDTFSNCDWLEKLIISEGLEEIENYAFSSEAMYKIYYKGTEESWSNININDNYINTSISTYYYSDTNPTTEGNYWHYEGNEIVEW